MIVKISKALWVGASVFVLFITLNGYHSEHDKGIWDALTWLMLLLSFPAGLAVSLVIWALETGFSITSKTTYLSLATGWAGYFFLGYLQWFKLVPYLIGKLRAFRKPGAESNNL